MPGPLSRAESSRRDGEKRRDGEGVRSRQASAARHCAHDDGFRTNEIDENYDASNEIVTRCIDYDQCDRNGPLENSTPTPLAPHSEDREFRKAFSRLTADDFDQFLNVFRVVFDSDPNADENINGAGTQHLLSGALSNGEYFIEKRAAESDDKSAPANEKAQADIAETDYTFFDVYDHIESWKQRMRPTVSKIEDITQECTAIVRQTSTADDTSEIDKRMSKITLEQTFGNYDVVINSSRYLSNIDKYIEIRESRNFRSKIVQLQSQNGNNSIDESLILTDQYYTQHVLDESSKDTKGVQMPQIDVENQGTLLVPSNAYLKTGLKSNDYNILDVKTYFIE